jgi:uncharacterized protein
VATTYPFRTALVTGASSGIGEAMVRRLAGDGVETVVVARRAPRLSALARELRGLDALAADLTVDEDLATVAARVSDPEQPIDLLVNNAGFGTSGLIADIERARLENEIRLNVLALTTLTRAALPGMIERHRGWVLNVSSMAGFQPIPTLGVYAATKAYVTSFTEALHEELRGSGVVATALCPGLTRTEFIEVSRSERPSARYPSVAWMSADQVAVEGLRDTARGRAVSVPGFQNRLFATTSGFVPRGLKRRAAGLARSFTR